MTPVINLAKYRANRLIPSYNSGELAMNGKRASISQAAAKSIATVLYDCLSNGGQCSAGFFVVRELVCDKFEFDMTAIGLGVGECEREQAVELALRLLGAW